MTALSRRGFVFGAGATLAVARSGVLMRIPLIIEPTTVGADYAVPYSGVDLLEEVYQRTLNQMLFQEELPCIVKLGLPLDRLCKTYDQPMPTQAEIDQLVHRFDNPQPLHEQLADLRHRAMDMASLV